jgi:serine/threonine protein kinase
MEIDASSAGTLEYLPPERLSKKRRLNPIKRSVDVWALGIILY